MASDETSGVMMAYFMIGILRVAGVLASRRELQDKGVLEVDCPVCLGQLCGGEGRVIFHVLECGHRCEAARTGSFPAGDDAKVDHLPPPPPPPLRVSQDPPGMPVPNREDARCRRRRFAPVPGLP